MLRVGLTGDLGTGKSTVARLLAARGAFVFSSDEMARAMMQPGQEVYDAVVVNFGPSILAADGSLDRRRLAALAFDPAHPRVEELNRIVHPAVLAAQAREVAALVQTHPHAIAVVESALIFSSRYAPQQAWRSRFDRILLVTAPEEQKVARFVTRMSAGRALCADERTALEVDAYQRLAVQQATSYPAGCMVLSNEGDLEQLEHKVEAVWLELQQIEKTIQGDASASTS